MTEEEKKAIEELEEFIKGPCETCKYCEAAYKLNRKNIIQLLNLTKKIQKENKKLKEKNDINIAYAEYLEKILNEYKKESVLKQKVKDIIDRIDYDIKKTKEIISNNSNNYTSDRKNDYQIVRLRAMNTKSLDIKKRLQELLESEE